MTRFPSTRLERLVRATGIAHAIAHARSRLAHLVLSIRLTPRRLLDQLRELPQLVAQHVLHIVALAALILSMGGTWMLAKDANAAPGKSPTTTTTKTTTTATVAAAGGAPLTDDDLPRMRPAKKEVTGKLNLNTATEEQLMLLPSIGPSKAERVVTWRTKNGSFKRTADLRRVKGFGYKTFKRLEPFLDIKGDSTLAARR